MSVAAAFHEVLGRYTGVDAAVSAAAALHSHLLHPFRESAGHALALGVRDGGATVAAMAEFLENAAVTGIDAGLADDLPHGADNPRVRFVRQPPPAGPDACLYDVIVLLDSEEDQLGAFRTWAPRIAPGGMFVIAAVDPQHSEALRTGLEHDVELSEGDLFPVHWHADESGARRVVAVVYRDPRSPN